MILLLRDPFHAENRRGRSDRGVPPGATFVADFDEYGTQWASLLDPEGNEFDKGASV